MIKKMIKAYVLKHGARIAKEKILPVIKREYQKRKKR